MEIKTKNNRTLIFRQITDERIWETKTELSAGDDFRKFNYQFSFKEKIISKKYIIEGYDFNSYLINFIDRFIENEEKILKISRKILDDIKNVNDNFALKHNSENSPLFYVRILNIVNYSFKVYFSTNYGYEEYIIKYLVYDNGDFVITKVKRKLCY
ncbi:hypothetical protein [Flavobacterium ginsengiterrae]|uniref:Uncharacterized protein n=1 Tax=Flavobacterium ginsengiterrae TaxID=871695 RepID=A0ABP7GQE4_9FLAO